MKVRGGASDAEVQWYGGEITRVLHALQRLRTKRLRSLDGRAGATLERLVSPEPDIGLLLECVIADWSSAAETGAAEYAACTRAFRLGPSDHDALALAIGVELDRRISQILGSSELAAAPRPTLDLLAALAAERGTPRSAIDLAGDPAISHRLLELGGPGPLAERYVSVAGDVLARLASSAPRLPDGIELHAPDPTLIDHVVVADDCKQRVARWAQIAASGRAPVLVLAGKRGTGRRTLALAAAGIAGLPVIVARLTAENVANLASIARREATWYGAMLLLRVEAALDVGALAAIDRPLAIAVTPDLVETAWNAFEEPALIASLPDLDAARRADLLSHVLPSLDEATIARVAARFDAVPARLVRAARRAVLEQAFAGEGTSTAAQLTRALRETSAVALSPLIDRVATTYTRDDLVVTDEVARELDLARMWLTHHPTVFGRWGLGRRVPSGRAMTALFDGPPGTGKTMAAQVLAGELGLDLYRIDLAQLVSKYIGETEKNLSRVFEEAAATGAMLLFDEADALFGKRAATKDAQDRFANLELAYLLQRIEDHTGPTILATNRRSDMDEAFVRRIHIIVNFPRPNVALRRRIWDSMLVPQLERAADLDVDRLAAFDLTGGEIRNVLVAAAFRAADEQRPLGMAHLCHGILRELRRAGRVIDEKNLGWLRAQAL